MAGRSRGVYRAVLLGVGVGDAVGRPLEIAGYGPAEDWLEEAPLPPRLGGVYMYSDDTEMTLLLAETLVEECGFNPRVFAEKLASRAGVGHPYRGYGAGTSHVIVELRRGRPWWVVARSLYGGQGSYGNGAAIRVSPIPLFYSSKAMTESMAVAQALVTHTHPLGVEAARLLAVALHYTLEEGVGPRRLPRILELEAYHEEFRARLRAIEGLLSAKPPRVAEVIGNSVAGYESVPAAIYAYTWAEGDPGQALLAALSLGGDADSIASMALALAAAHQGSLGAMLEKIAEDLEDREYIVGLAEKLYEKHVECIEQGSVQAEG